MNGKRSLIYYFDACVYLSYLQNDSQSYGANAIQAIDDIWKENAKGGASIITSTLTLTEVLSHKLNSKTEKVFMQAVTGGLHTLIDVEPPIAIRAREYRDYYKKNPVRHPSHKDRQPCGHLATPDAIHLATATLYGCDQFLTFDGTSNEKKGTIGLLWLGNKAGDDDIIIAPPKALQGRLL